MIKTKTDRDYEVLAADPRVKAACDVIGSKPGIAPCAYPSDIADALAAADAVSNRGHDSQRGLAQHYRARCEKLEAALLEAIEWDGQDIEGVDAVWLKRAREALGDEK